MSNNSNEIILSPEDMPNDDLRLVAELCGVSTARVLLEKMAGTSLYIPSSGYSTLMKKEIQKKFNSGVSPNRLAVEYGISVQKIREITKGK